MRFDSDLLNWTNYVKLFDLQNSQVLNNDEPVAINILPEENLSDNEISDNNGRETMNENTNSDADENLVIDNQLEVEPTENIPKEDNKEPDDYELTQLHQFDESLMRNLTQIQATKLQISWV